MPSFITANPGSRCGGTPGVDLKEWKDRKRGQKIRMTCSDCGKFVEGTDDPDLLSKWNGANTTVPTFQDDEHRRVVIETIRSVEGTDRDLERKKREVIEGLKKTGVK